MGINQQTIIFVVILTIFPSPARCSTLKHANSNWFKQFANKLDWIIRCKLHEYEISPTRRPCRLLNYSPFIRINIEGGPRIFLSLELSASISIVVDHESNQITRNIWKVGSTSKLGNLLTPQFWMLKFEISWLEILALAWRHENNLPSDNITHSLFQDNYN